MKACNVSGTAALLKMRHLIIRWPRFRTELGFLPMLNSQGMSRSTQSSAEVSGSGGSGGKDTAAAQRRSLRDPGHLLASLSCANAQVKDESSVVMQRHDFALDTTLGPAAFSHSKVSIQELYLYYDCTVACRCAGILYMMPICVHHQGLPRRC